MIDLLYTGTSTLSHKCLILNQPTTQTSGLFRYYAACSQACVAIKSPWSDIGGMFRPARWFAESAAGTPNTRSIWEEYHERFSTSVASSGESKPERAKLRRKRCQGLWPTVSAT